MNETPEASRIAAGEDQPTDMQFIGDVMILQVLADSDQINEQEREVLQRWIGLADRRDAALLMQSLEALQQIDGNLKMVADTSMDAVLGPTYYIYGIERKKLTPAIKALRERLDRVRSIPSEEVPRG